LKSFLKTGVVSGASDPDLLEKVVGRVKDTLKVYSQPVAVLGGDRQERLEKKMKRGRDEEHLREKDQIREILGCIDTIEFVCIAPVSNSGRPAEGSSIYILAIPKGW
jgi:hypothetical protein